MPIWQILGIDVLIFAGALLGFKILKIKSTFNASMLLVNIVLTSLLLSYKISLVEYWICFAIMLITITVFLL